MTILRNIYNKPIISGAMLSKKDACKMHALAFMGLPFLFFLFFYIALTEKEENLFSFFISWAFAIFLLYLVTVGIAIVYGYHQRDRIDTDGAHRIDFGLANRVAVFVAMTLPLFRMLLEWLGLG